MPGSSGNTVSRNPSHILCHQGKGVPPGGGGIAPCRARIMGSGNARAFRETGVCGNVSGSGHPVPHPDLGENVGGTPGVVPELAAEAADEGAQEPGVVLVFRSPDPPEQPLLGQHPSGVVRKLLEQPVLGRGQPHRTAGHRHAAFGVVDRQLLQDEGFGFPVALLLAGLSLGLVDYVLDQAVQQVSLPADCVEYPAGLGRIGRGRPAQRDCRGPLDGVQGCLEVI